MVSFNRFIFYFLCFILRCESGQLGYEDLVQRGDESGEMGDNLPTIDFGSGQRVLHVQIGEFHSCAVMGDETLRCFGRSDAGQLGFYLFLIKY